MRNVDDDGTGHRDWSPSLCVVPWI
jgi:hypothetical protein